jgi:H+/Cl- antiporter ClcA
VLIPVASLGFLRSGMFAPAVAMGLTLGGIVGTLAAVPLVSVLADHLTVMRWLVTGVITYAAIAMLRSAMATPAEAPD